MSNIRILVPRQARGGVFIGRPTFLAPALYNSHAPPLRNRTNGGGLGKSSTPRSGLASLELPTQFMTAYGARRRMAPTYASAMEFVLCELLARTIAAGLFGYSP